MITWWSLVEAHFLCQKVSLWLFVSAKNILEIWKRNLKFGANCFRFHISYEVSPTFFLKKYACFTDCLGFFVGSREGNPGCWGGDFTFERCCIDANDPKPDALVSEVSVNLAAVNLRTWKSHGRFLVVFFVVLSFFVTFSSIFWKAFFFVVFRRSKFSKIILEVWELVCTGNSSKNTYICNIYVCIYTWKGGQKTIYR